MVGCKPWGSISFHEAGAHLWSQSTVTNIITVLILRKVEQGCMRLGTSENSVPSLRAIILPDSKLISGTFYCFFPLGWLVHSPSSFSSSKEIVPLLICWDLSLYLVPAFAVWILTAVGSFHYLMNGSQLVMFAKKKYPPRKGTWIPMNSLVSHSWCPNYFIPNY